MNGKEADTINEKTGKQPATLFHLVDYGHFVL